MEKKDMNLFDTEFKRKFSISMYKNLKIALGEMTFLKDFVNTARGDLYPILQKSEDCEEIVGNNLYTVTKGTVKRIFCNFFPYASYEVTAKITDGEIGFCFQLPDAEANVLVKKGKLVYFCGDNTKEAELPDFVQTDFTMVVSCRPGAFDIYFKKNNKPEFVCTF